MRAWKAILIALFAGLGGQACVQKIIYVSGHDCLQTDPPDTGVWIDLNGHEVAANDLNLIRYYPDRALRQDQIGKASLHCIDDVCRPTDQAMLKQGAKQPTAGTARPISRTMDSRLPRSVSPGYADLFLRGGLPISR